MKKLRIFILLTTLLIPNLYGQKTDSLKIKFASNYLLSNRNSINFEAFGHGLYYSLSYERIFLNDHQFKLAGQAGIAVYPYPDQIDLWIPISINYIKTIGSKRKNHAEIGLGHIVRYDQLYDRAINDPWQTFITAKAGYRYQKPNGRWIFKILFTPFYEYNKKDPKASQPSFKTTLTFDNTFPSGAISIGYAF